MKRPRSPSRSCILLAAVLIGLAFSSGCSAGSVWDFFNHNLSLNIILPLGLGGDAGILNPQPQPPIIPVATDSGPIGPTGPPADQL